jgi:hypothetical protein
VVKPFISFIHIKLMKFIHIFTRTLSEKWFAGVDKMNQEDKMTNWTRINIYDGLLQNSCIRCENLRVAAWQEYLLYVG